MPARSTRPSGIDGELAEIDALGRQRRRSPACRSARAAASASSRSARRSAVISRASSSIRPAPNRWLVLRSLENCGSSVIEIGALEALGDEDIGGEIAGAADDRLVVAGLSRRWRPGRRCAGTWLDRMLALGRDDRLGRHRPAERRRRGELGVEQRLAVGASAVERVSRSACPLSVAWSTCERDGALGPGLVAGRPAGLRRRRGRREATIAARDGLSGQSSVFMRSGPDSRRQTRRPGRRRCCDRASMPQPSSTSGMFVVEQVDRDVRRGRRRWRPPGVAQRRLHQVEGRSRHGRRRRP